MRWIGVGLCVAGLTGALRAQEPPPLSEPQGRFGDSVSVEQVLMEVRVLDGQGRPVPGLTPSDFRVQVEGRPVTVESVKWIDASTPDTLAAGGTELVAAGRSLLLLFQKDLDASRGAGFLRMVQRAAHVIDGLPAADRVAVASYDTRLHLWTDFTTDRQRARQAVDRGVVMGKRSPEAAADGPSLQALLGGETERRAANLEQALRLLGEALEGIPGERSLVLVGSYLGRNPANLVEADYEAAQRALSRARVAVYSLDVTDADWHTLEAGMQAVAADTGGFYARTHDFAAQATDRLQGALEGHYLVSFPKPTKEPGFHEVDIRLARGGVRVLARPGYRDGGE
jgi:VWFA-related protein